MSLKPYQKPYCQIFYHGSVSASGDPAPLVPADMHGPGINEVTTNMQLASTCDQRMHPGLGEQPITLVSEDDQQLPLMSAGELCHIDKLHTGYAARLK